MRRKELESEKAGRERVKYEEMEINERVEKEGK